MPFCPYCKQIVGENVTECPSCGMSWAGQVQQQQPQPQTQPQYEQQPPQQYQQPPPQPQYQQPPPQYQQPQPQPQYQQPPPQQYQPQPQYQQPPQYQQAPVAPYPPAGVTKRVVGVGSMMAAMIGGVMALVASYMFYLNIGLNGLNYIHLWDYMDFAPDAFLYLWMLPVGGILALLFAIIGWAIQSRPLGILVGLGGLGILLLPVIFAVHCVVEYNASFVDIFYTSWENMNNNMEFNIFLGGFMCIFAGITVMAGGFGLAASIRREKEHALREDYNRHYRR